jgi:hypothetical protein
VEGLIAHPDEHVQLLGCIHKLTEVQQRVVELRLLEGATCRDFTTKDTVIDVSGLGPFTLTYVKPADDPSKAAATARVPLRRSLVRDR